MSAPTADPWGGGVLRVVAGAPDEVEIAAVVAVLGAVARRAAGVEPAPPGRRPRPTHVLPAPAVVGAPGWSGAPRRVCFGPAPPLGVPPSRTLLGRPRP